AFLFGRPLRIRSPHSAVRKGIGMVPEDRKQQGVILSLSIQQNVSLPNFHKITNKLGFIKANKARDEAKELIRKLSIKTQSEKAEVATLSGGNQQKVSLAKWISRNSKVMIIDEPTRGVDVGAKVEIYKLINELSRQGMAIIVVSSETEELIGICDRILVMRKGQIQGELEKKDFSEENILRLSIGK
ncbi:MAG: sugar ABC transporter ATP-binding protein, partial [Bacteroidales bacterium]|nr:sugar ABC transporter ATP-binding protein [Bacteroidales bacterium]